MPSVRSPENEARAGAGSRPASSDRGWAATLAEGTLLDRLLAEQQDLSAVERFASAHELEELPAQAKYYSRLLPASPPGPGEQYAFEVDLDRCSGCKACVTACHALNGLDDDEAWRQVGLLHGGRSAEPVLQHVTSACHHCVDPACLNVCPVRAYEKDPLTGIVKHLDDQCFGCQYCTFACPYDVPRYSPSRGIVRKCDMCSSRLAVGEASACVQSCPHEAIRISVVSTEDVVADCAAGIFLPGAPQPQITLPTTAYKTSRVLPRNLLPADYDRVAAGHAHVPLVAMLVLTQLSVGAFLVNGTLRWFGVAAIGGWQAWHAAFALVCGLLAIAASTLHLGRPHLAWRAILGLRSSWLSREILAFGLFAALATVRATGLAAAHLLPGLQRSLLGASIERAIDIGVVAIGLVGVGCSIMIYQCVRRPTWTAGAVAFRFLMTTAVLGTAAVWWTAVVGAWATASNLPSWLTEESFERLAVLVAGLTAVKLMGEAAALLHLADRLPTPRQLSARLLTTDLVKVTVARFVVGLLAGVLIPLALGARMPLLPAGAAWIPALATVSFVGLVVAELLERWLFFSAAVAPRMPGGGA